MNCQKKNSVLCCRLTIRNFLHCGVPMVTKVTSGQLPGWQSRDTWHRKATRLMDFDLHKILLSLFCVQLRGMLENWGICWSEYINHPESQCKTTQAYLFFINIWSTALIFVKRSSSLLWFLPPHSLIRGIVCVEIYVFDYQFCINPDTNVHWLIGL